MIKPINPDETFKPLSGSNDSLLFDNPDRGFRTELCLLIKEHYPDEIYFGEGVRFDTLEDAEKHKVEKGPGYVYSPVKDEDGNDLYYVVKFVEKARSVFCDMDDSYNEEVLDGLFRSYFRLDYDNNPRFDPCHLVLAYLYLTDFHDREIPTSALKCMGLYFEFCRKRKIKNNLRISYNWEYLITHTEGDKNRWLLASECANQESIDLHTRQLCPVIAEYRDTIHTISNGFVGFVGEWAWHYQWPEVDYNKAMMSIVENLCKPNNLYFSARLPKYRYNFEKTYPDYPYLHLVSLNNDAFFGEQEYESPYTRPDGTKTVTRWNSESYGKNILDKEYNIGWWDYTTASAYKTPQGGELYVQQVLTSWNMRPDGYDCNLECAHHRHTSFSYWHGYLDTNENPDYFDTNIMTAWMNPDDKYGYYAPMSIEKAKELGVSYDPAWFYDEEGNEIKDRNAYNFIRDHLGYRIALQSLRFDWSGNSEEKAKVTLNLKNYGFAAAFNLSAAIELLDADGKAISSAKAGDPDKWISLPPDFYVGYEVKDAESNIITHKVYTEISMPEKCGEYKLVLRISDYSGNGARLANDIVFENEANILTTIKI